MRQYESMVVESSFNVNTWKMVLRSDRIFVFRVESGRTGDHGFDYVLIILLSLTPPMGLDHLSSKPGRHRAVGEAAETSEAAARRWEDLGF